MNENIVKNDSLDCESILTIFNEDEVEKKLNDIMSIEDSIEQAMEYFCWATRAQLYWDGNKRTSTIVANAILIKNGAGLFTINEDTAEIFNERFLTLYNQNDDEPLKRYMRQQIEYISNQFSFDNAQ